MLTDLQARKIRPGGKPVGVGGVVGLYFRPGAATGTGRFVLRFVSPETGRRRDMGLGSYPDTGIAAARHKAGEARALLARDLDPIEEAKRAADTIPATPAPTFREAAQRVHADVAAGFRNPKHRAQWINTLRDYAFPVLGERPVATLTTADFARILSPIWLDKAETASRVRQRCERVMTWCLAQGLVEANPVSAVDALLPRQPPKRDRVTHHPSVPWRDLPAIWEGLFAGDRLSVGKRALQFLILTAARSGEVRHAVWDEIDWSGRTWIVPAERTKTHVRHRVPLSDQACAVLRAGAAQTGGAGLIFSRSGASPISDMTLTKILRDHRVPSDTDGRAATAHGFRASFRDWASETGYPRDLAEKALAHVVKSQTEAAYHRTDLLDQRRHMMQAWADHVVDRDPLA